MDILLNPIILSVVALCALCLARVNVLISLLVAALVAGLAGGLSITKTMTVLADGFSGNAMTALSYILLGTFAATFIARLLHKHRWIAWIGLVLILYVATRMMLEGAGAFFDIPEIPLLYSPHAAAAH